MKKNASDLFKIFRFLREKTMYSSGTRIEEYQNEPIYNLIYENIMSYSIKELEEAKDQRNVWKEESLFNSALNTKNIYIFSALMEKGAFKKNLMKESRWFLSKVKKEKNLSDEEQIKQQDFNFKIYNLVYYLETSNNKTLERKKEDVLTNIMDYIIINYSGLSVNERVSLMKDFVDEFGIFSKQRMSSVIFEEAERNVEVLEVVVKKMIRENIDLSTMPINEHIFKHNDDFISSTLEPKIKILLDWGFSFDEEQYKSKDGDNLFLSILKMNRKKLNEIILPTLKSVKPKDKTLEEQTNYVNSLDDGNYSKEKKLYFGLLLENKLDKKEDSKKQFKV